jgi:hypothetical protein
LLQGDFDAGRHRRRQRLGPICRDPI